jgi:hypothetical protein
MLVEQCHKPPIEIDGFNPTYKKGRIWDGSLISPELARLAKVPRTQSDCRTKRGSELGPWCRWHRFRSSMGSPG